MSLSKVYELVTITHYKSTEVSFELSRAYSTTSLNVGAANVFNVNKISDALNNLSHICSPNIADGKIGALLTPLHSPTPLTSFTEIRFNRLV